MRNPNDTKRWEFVVGTSLSLAKTITDDEDVFLLALAAVAPRRLSNALIALVACRRLDSALNVLSHYAGRAVVRMENPPVTSTPGTWIPGPV